MTSSNSKFQKPRKKTLANICQIICGKFHQNRFIRLGCRDDTHIQTHTHTHTHTKTHTHTYRHTHTHTNTHNIYLLFNNALYGEDYL